MYRLVDRNGGVILAEYALHAARYVDALMLASSMAQTQTVDHPGYTIERVYPDNSIKQIITITKAE